MRTIANEPKARREIRERLYKSGMSEGRRIRILDDFDTLAFTLRLPESQCGFAYTDAFSSVFGDGVLGMDTFSDHVGARYDPSDDSLPARMSRVGMRLHALIRREMNNDERTQEEKLYFAESVIMGFLWKYKYNVEGVRI